MNTFGSNLKEIYPDLKKAALRITHYNDADADDLVQKGLLRAFEKQDLFKGGNLTGWIVTIMKNIFIDEIRKIKDKQFVDIEDEILVNDYGEHHNLEVNDTRSALARLSKKCQNMLNLIAEEFKYSEISLKLEMPIGTVMSQLQRCRKQLYVELNG